MPPLRQTLCLLRNHRRNRIMVYPPQPIRQTRALLSVNATKVLHTLGFILLLGGATLFVLFLRQRITIKIERLQGGFPRALAPYWLHTK